MTRKNKQSGTSGLAQIASIVTFYRTSTGRELLELSSGASKRLYYLDDDSLDLLENAVMRELGFVPTKKDLKLALARRPAKSEQRVVDVITRYGLKNNQVVVATSPETVFAIGPDGIEPIDGIHVLYQEDFIPIDYEDAEIEVMTDHLSPLFPDKGDLLLVIAFLVESVLTNTDYPMLMVNGPKGSGKSTISEMLKTIVDPSNYTLLPPPSQLEDIKMAAATNHMVVFENVSSLNSRIQDLLCIRSTGGTRVERKLHTNSKAARVDLGGATIINSIDDPTTQRDLQDRTILVELTERKGSTTQRSILLESFQLRLPALRGAFFRLVGKVVIERQKTSISNLPRMADYTITLKTVARVLGISPSIAKKASVRSRNKLARNFLSRSPLGIVLSEIIENAELPWKIKFDALKRQCEVKTNSPPTTSRAFGSEFSQLIEPLSKLHDVNIERIRGTKGFYVRVTRNE
jgi:energy-coupling factor transporter ATP-binding protein EcfA2